MVGLTEDRAKAQGIKVKKGLFPWAASGRAITNGRILGGSMVGTHAGDIMGEVTLVNRNGRCTVDIVKNIPHPPLSESIGIAAEVAHGTCTDVPPVRN